MLDQGADAQRARRRPGGKGHEVFEKDGDHTIKLTRRMKLWHFSASMSTDDDGGRGRKQTYIYCRQISFYKPNKLDLTRLNTKYTTITS